MTDRPIIFSAPMIRALLDGTKTQTRRVLRSQPGEIDMPQVWEDGTWHVTASDGSNLSPLDVRFTVGDRLWVREAHAILARPDHGMPANVAYRADAEPPIPVTWRSPIHMPRWASRLTLTVQDVRVQQLQEISEEDAWEEGVDRRSRKVRQFWLFGADQAARERIYKQAAVWEYEDLWNGLHGPDAWSANPWVVVLTFAVEKRNIDALARAA